ncbi:MAG: nuclear transport factor 2 family protein [Pseudomonadota bacterium]
MVSCLTLVDNTHALAPGDTDFHRTLCGLAVAITGTSGDLFASAPSAATCPRCRRKLEFAAASAAPEEKRPATRSLVLSLVRQLNTGRLEGPDALLAGPFLASFTSQRVERLHQLFPGWHASVEELIVDESSCLLRYGVECLDAFGLLGPAGPRSKTGQAVILRLADGRVTDASPLVDAFAFWAAAAHRFDTTCAHCIPPVRLS